MESLYEYRTGQRFNWESYPFQGYPSRVQIPAELFEETILPYFAMSLEEFRSRCGYNEASGTCPWRHIHGDDLTAWHYPLCEPEVASWRENTDGTITMEVQVYSPDLKTNRLFCHAVTVRPLEDGFQFVANRVTYVSDRGLPPAMPRFALDG